MTLLQSWVSSANSPETDFPLNNLPYGVFSTEGTDPRCGVAIGNMIFDCQAAEEAGFIEFDEGPVFDVPFWNELMELGPDAWAALRACSRSFSGMMPRSRRPFRDANPYG